VNYILVIGIISGDKKTEGKLESDGFPPIGTLLQEGDPYYWYVFIIARSKTPCCCCVTAL